MNYSPLRYPGGKAKIAPFIKSIIQNLQISNITYIEPFAGGAGVAISLLLEGFADRIIINDYDKAIYSFWRAIKEDPHSLIKLIQKTPLTIDEWRKQKLIYSTKNNKYSVELGFSALFLNRTNRSGILSAGPIGGFMQNGNYTIEARFNRDSLVRKIQNIASQKHRISVYNKDIRNFIHLVMPKYAKNSFAYFDPPYYTKGQRLYKNSLSPTDHATIAKYIIEKIDCPWVITYDNVSELKEIYSAFPQRQFHLNYSVANKGKGTELIIFKSDRLIPTHDTIQKNMKNFYLFQESTHVQEN